ISSDDLSVRVGKIADRRSDTVIAGTLVRSELFEFLCIEIVRMRVEPVQHTVNSRFEYRVVIDLFAENVVVLDHGQGFGKIAFYLFGRNGWRFRLRKRVCDDDAFRDSVVALRERIAGYESEQQKRRGGIFDISHEVNSRIIAETPMRRSFLLNNSICLTKRSG